MKKILLFTFIAALSVYNFMLGKQDADRAANQASTLTLSTIAQTTTETEIRRIKFAYDASGNRTSRQLIWVDPPSTALRSSSVASADTTEEISEDHSEAIVKKIEIRIFPNPTQGFFKVEIDNLPAETPANILLYNFSGLLIDSRSNVDFSTSFDLTAHPAGTYIMKIYAGTEHSSWKIIKN